MSGPERDQTETLSAKARLNSAPVRRGAGTPTRLGVPGCQMSISFSASLGFIDPGPLIRGPVHLPDPEPDATEVDGSRASKTARPGKRAAEINR